MADFSTEIFQGEARNRFGQALGTVIPIPFASCDEDAGKIPTKYNAAKVNYVTGFPSAYEVMPQRSGKSITPSDLNDVAYLATLGGFLGQIGYRPTFSSAVCEAIGGYPKGTVLTDFSAMDDSDSDKYAIVRNVISLQDNNKQNFVYDEETNPEPYVIGSTVDGKVWWKYVYDIPQKIDLFAPDYEESEEIASFTTIERTSYEWTSDFDGWIRISIGAGHGLELRQKAQGSKPPFSANVIERLPDAIKEIYTIIPDDEQSKINSVYYFGYLNSMPWKGRMDAADRWNMIYNTMNGTRYGGVFPVNVGSMHKIQAYIEDDTNQLLIRIDRLGHFQNWSE